MDLLNMSVALWGMSEIALPTSTEDSTFHFAIDNGVALVAAAGNFTRELPQDEMHIRPATRTPGVLTVGARRGRPGSRLT